jgi:hypothetical protein
LHSLGHSRVKIENPSYLQKARQLAVSSTELPRLCSRPRPRSRSRPLSLSPLPLLPSLAPSSVNPSCQISTWCKSGTLLLRGPGTIGGFGFQTIENNQAISTGSLVAVSALSFKHVLRFRDCSQRLQCAIAMSHHHDLKFTSLLAVEFLP